MGRLFEIRWLSFQHMQWMFPSILFVWSPVNVANFDWVILFTAELNSEYSCFCLQKEIEELHKRLVVLGCQLRKAEVGKRTYEVATEKLIHFAEVRSTFRVLRRVHSIQHSMQCCVKWKNFIVWPPLKLLRAMEELHRVATSEIEAPFTRIRIFFSVLAFLPHVYGVFDHWKRRFSKTL